MTHDCVVIGGGPAGIAAALSTSSLGLKTVLIDEQPRPGGQIYRDVGASDQALRKLLGSDYTHGLELVERLTRAGVEIQTGGLVWDISDELVVSVSQDGRNVRFSASQILAATGAMERASPISGWTLPGVMNAGAAQIALKSSGSIPAGRVLLVGGGPLLLLVACQLAEAGATVAGVIETMPLANKLAALRHLPQALMAPRYLGKGLGMLAKLKSMGIPRFKQAVDVRIEGAEVATGVAFQCQGKVHRIEADTILLHHGVVPNTQLGRMLRIEHEWDREQLAWRPRVDEWGNTSMPGLRILGDGARISGALAAEASGHLAALDAAFRLGRISREERDMRAQVGRKAFRRHRDVRPFLDALYRPPEWIANPTDATVVCRCEEVTAGQIREMARLGCRGPNQTKFFSRCGMGPCQGRTCGLVVTQILAKELALDPACVGSYHVRAPLKPIPLSVIAHNEI